MPTLLALLLVYNVKGKSSILAFRMLGLVILRSLSVRQKLSQFKTHLMFDLALDMMR